MSDADAVLAANAAFYDAFSRRDADLMDAVWAHQTGVACIHPGWEVLRGRDAVLASWHAIFGGGGAPPIRCETPSVAVLGDVAVVSCVERVPGGELAATNVFVREAGGWHLLHHHAGPIAPQAETPEGTLH